MPLRLDQCIYVFMDNKICNLDIISDLKVGGDGDSSFEFYFWTIWLGRVLPGYILLTTGCGDFGGCPPRPGRECAVSIATRKEVRR